MDEWMDGVSEGEKKEWEKSVWKEKKRMNEWMDRRTIGWMDGWMEWEKEEERMDGWMNQPINEWTKING